MKIKNYLVILIIWGGWFLKLHLLPWQTATFDEINARMGKVLSAECQNTRTTSYIALVIKYKNDTSHELVRLRDFQECDQKFIEMLTFNSVTIYSNDKVIFGLKIGDKVILDYKKELIEFNDHSKIFSFELIIIIILTVATVLFVNRKVTV